MGNAHRTPADLPRTARNTVRDAENEGGHSPAENARRPENAFLRAPLRPTAREALSAVLNPPSAPAFADSPQLAELIARHALGMIAPKAADRLAAIFEADPADALDRLERACTFLGVTGDRAAELVDEAARRALEAQGRTPAPAHPLADASAYRHAGTPAGNADCVTAESTP